MILDKFRALYNALRGRVKVKEVIKVVPYEVTRQQLGSIDKQNVRYLKSMSEEEYAEHISEIDSIFSKSAFKTELDGLLDAQVYWMGEKASAEQMPFGRGTVNGISLVRERFELLSGEHRKKSEPKEKVETSEMFP